MRVKLLFLLLLLLLLLLSLLQEPIKLMGS